jgi:hypothetical protein
VFKSALGKLRNNIDQGIRNDMDDKDYKDDKDMNNQQQGVGVIPGWNQNIAYFRGDKVVYNLKIYEARWWSMDETPEDHCKEGPWKLFGDI